ncbi:MAG: tRNA uridine-5-carboxymethylaminomethyl(34) synthesis GTPase MnmE [Candidatus Omnitrophica bacterium]|nr:tRNA uridine-5-carboxymethylaminomethyl(34) synthesis GTPase MnmE [Candidatus Omnitrophota bacterium]
MVCFSLRLRLADPASLRSLFFLRLVDFSLFYRGNMRSANDTIAAIATPPGEGGIAIVRLSGEEALGLAESIFEPSSGKPLSGTPSHTIRRGRVTSPAGDVIDEVLVSVMKAPRSYTAEDVVEINCHGGIVPVRKVLERCLSAGARLAEPGEFTKRAFLNGRLDLSQAEAVLDVIRSSTDAACRVALDQLKGGFSAKVVAIRDAVLDIVSAIELSIDFSQEDVEFPVTEKIGSRINRIAEEISELLSTADKGIILREGANIVICGRPNVGKSSLMNALLRHDRVIVTPVAGTTRDVIEETIDLGGVSARITDTAGIIETTDRVELEGIKRSKEKLEAADVVIFMLDSSRELSRKDEEIFDTVKAKETVIVANKSDLPAAFDTEAAADKFFRPVIKASVLKGEGLDEIETSVKRLLFKGDTDLPEGVLVTSLRHRDLLRKALSALARQVEGQKGPFNWELAASDLNEAVMHLGLITGEEVDDSVLDRIFSRFCIGK